jgi:hypothetical protein
MYYVFDRIEGGYAVLVDIFGTSYNVKLCDLESVPQRCGAVYLRDEADSDKFVYSEKYTKMLRENMKERNRSMFEFE